jgi:flagellar P-ring protein precursor FlgI
LQQLEKLPVVLSSKKNFPLAFSKKKAIRLALKNPDFTTAARVEKTINQELGGKFAEAKDSTTIDLVIPPNYQRKVVELIAIMENFRVITDQKAKIVINERTGTIVAGGDIILRKSAISHGDLVIEIGGEAGKKAVHMIDEKTSLNDLVQALNAIGTGPEDLINIFQTLKTNGALVADLEFI